MIVPRRVEAAWFAATRNAIEPSPCPLAPEVIEIQSAVVAADHEHSRAMLTASVPFPPAGAKLDGAFDTDAWHRPSVEVGAVALVTPELPQPIASAAAAIANSRGPTVVFTASRVSILDPATMDG